MLKDPKQIEAVESIRRVDDAGRLYYMESEWNYYELPEEFQAMINPGCSTFFTRNLEGEQLFCRNYDYTHRLGNIKTAERTGINVICKSANPQAKYKSLGVADAFWLDFKNASLGEGKADDGITDISAFAMIPYICMDGMNEAGLSISIMALVVKCQWEEIEYDTYKEKLDPNKENIELKETGEVPDENEKKAGVGSIAYNDIDKKAWICHKEWIKTTMPGKKTVLHPILMRLILDNCANVQEAVAFADQFNVASAMPGSDNHILIADKEGNSRLLEWVDNKMNVIDINHATNYRVSADDIFHGRCPRDECIKAGLFRTEKGGMREDFAENLMKLIVQDPTNGNDTGKTQYSCIYNLNKLHLKIFSYGKFDKSWEFDL